MASTPLNELGWNPDAIERQLAHDERDDSRASYNHVQYLAGTGTESYALREAALCLQLVDEGSAEAGHFADLR